MAKRKRKNPFRSAQDEAQHRALLESEQTHSPSYRLAYTDMDFLLREDLRPVRLQLELLKPELIQRDLGIESTIVVYGSARIHSPKEAQQALKNAEKALKANPKDAALQHRLKVAEHAVKNSRYYEEARRFGYLVSSSVQHNSNGKGDYVIVTGGGPGIMEAANLGAHEANAKNIGLNIVLPMEQGPNPYITPELTFRFHYFAIRKMHFLIRARALVAFPGGYGTLDELFEALCLRQTGKIDPIPILLFGREFWQRVIHFDTLLEENMIAPADIHLFHFVDTAEEAWRVIVEFYQD